MSGPSDKARGAADRSLPLDMPITRANVQAALDDAHDPALGLDRSVCLRDVVEALREHGRLRNFPKYGGVSAVDFIEREFGGS